MKNDNQNNFEEYKKIVQNLKEEFKKHKKLENLIVHKHNGGLFVLRWCGDNISIIIESCFKEKKSKLLDQIYTQFNKHQINFKQ